MPNMRYCILQLDRELQLVEMPADYAYQLSALILRLNKEIAKLTAEQVPALPVAIAECDHLELLRDEDKVIAGLEYINDLEQSFSKINETSYPLVSLLTEIRALQAQLEQWAEEEAEMLS